MSIAFLICPDFLELYFALDIVSDIWFAVKAIFDMLSVIRITKLFDSCAPSTISYCFESEKNYIAPYSGNGLLHTLQPNIATLFPSFILFIFRIISFPLFSAFRRFANS